MKRPLKLVLPVIVVLAVGGLLLPGGIDPAVWTPPSPQPLEGPFAKNDRLKSIQRLDVGIDKGPAAIAIDAVARIYVGYADGRIVRFEHEGANYVEVSKVEAQPLAMAFDPGGDLAVAIGKSGLRHIDAYGDVGSYHLNLDPPLHAVTDVEHGFHSPLIYFTDASAKFTLEQSTSALLEHRPDGRLVSYDVVRRSPKVLMSDLAWPSGVAIGPDGAYLLVSESAAYRITRYWLTGEKAGTHDVFADNLPGTPGDLSFNGSDRFWVAITGLRHATIDSLADKPWLRRAAARLPSFLQGWLHIGSDAGSFVLGYDTDGKLIANLQYAGSDGFGPISSVAEHGPWLYFGSPGGSGVGRYPLNGVIATAPTPPPGAEPIVEHPQATERHDETPEEAAGSSRRGTAVLDAVPEPKPAASPSPAPATPPTPAPR